MRFRIVVGALAVATLASGIASSPADAATVAAVPGAATAGAHSATVQSAPAAGTRMPMKRLLNKLPVRAEHTAGYNRANYHHWIVIRNGCDAREIVLIQESRTRARTGAGCRVTYGTWRSKYDGVVTHNASKFDIDHFVPLAEVNRSGGYLWSKPTRTAYANDTTYSKTLIAVSASSNRSKGDDDPALWMPTDAKCWYAKAWVEVKYRWHLSVNQAEKRALLRYANACRGMVVVPPRAKITLGGAGTTTPPPTGSSGGLDPRFSTCALAKAHGYGPYYKGRDPEYAWYRDADHDGIVCE